MKTYAGSRSNGCCAVLVHEGGGSRPLAPRHDLRNHSPDGFEWGYSGSGPAQLALALAADVLGDDEAASAVYQRLKRRVVAALPNDAWVLTEDELSATIRLLSEGGGD